MGCPEGEVAMIAGAGGGIVRAHALLFAREGAHLVVRDVGCARDGGVQGDDAHGATKRGSVEPWAVPEISKALHPIAHRRGDGQGQFCAASPLRAISDFCDPPGFYEAVRPAGC
jgi:NAD(P)-dependent dehydrogenase (short-subunit alcohol dehydrogenase family)